MDPQKSTLVSEKSPDEWKNLEKLLVSDTLDNDVIWKKYTVKDKIKQNQGLMCDISTTVYQTSFFFFWLANNDGFDKSKKSKKIIQEEIQTETKKQLFKFGHYHSLLWMDVFYIFVTLYYL